MILIMIINPHHNRILNGKNIKLFFVYLKVLFCLFAFPLGVATLPYKTDAGVRPDFQSKGHLVKQNHK